MNSLTELISISDETIAITKKVLFLLHEIHDKDYSSFVGLTHRLVLLSSRLTFSEDITLIEMAQNNFEFLDTLKTALLLLQEKDYLPSESREHLLDLNRRIDTAINRINSLSLTAIRKLSDGFLQRKKPDKDFTEPVESIYKGGLEPFRENHSPKNTHFTQHNIKTENIHNLHIFEPK